MNTPTIRWMIRDDLSEVLDIEERSHEKPWPEQTFLTYLRARECVGRVAESEGLVLGFAIYELHKNKLVLANLAIHPDDRRTGVGRAIVEYLTSKLSIGRRTRLEANVPERNLDAQLFFRSMGFRATEIVTSWLHEEPEYRFEYRLAVSVDMPCNLVT